MKKLIQLNLCYQLILNLILGSFGTLYASLPGKAADKIILKYNVLRESICISELSTLANTGEISYSLKAYLKMANKQPEDLRRILNQNMDVDPVFLSKVLRSFAGDFVLDEVGQVIHSPSRRANRESLRGALVTSALSDRNIRIIEILENYPTSEIHVEGDHLAKIYQKIDAIVSHIPHFSF
ncbi:alpha/beta hydrolase [Cyanobacterium sp. uoEpiScrs1]|uniref:alpha/beta hydrolase n=1 Tax=Cyanobacterium sp. uoEpiScrs1 TaxID=2976343 RepID=UPI002B4620D4|nr:alpha/beta hydrolase [Cyanobacterium sp. uoEpiScrs1]